MQKSMITENNEQAKLRKAYKAWNHEKWLKRQEAYHKIIARDCYGCKKSKV